MRVALLMNFIAPYRVPLLEALRDQVGQLRVFVSTPMERNRSWKVGWGTLDVVVQRNITLRRRHRDVLGFWRQLEIHIPYDTLGRLARFRPDVIISGELGARSLQGALYKMFRPEVPFIIWATLSEESERSWGSVRLALRRFILGRADGVFVNGESGGRYISRFGFPGDRIFRVNQPVDVAMFAGHPRQRPDGAGSRLLYVGLLTPTKGLVGFATSLGEWAKRNPHREIEMWWLGEGELASKLQVLPSPPNLRHRFLGAVPYADLPQYYAQADILAFPSLLDEWGLVVNEAMASRMPVLGSIYSQAVDELVVEGETGWVYDPLSAESTAAALDRALGTSAQQLAGMRDAAQQRILSLTPGFASEVMARAIRELVAGGQRKLISDQTITAGTQVG